MKFKFYALKLVAVCVVVFILQLLIPGFTDLFVLDQSRAVEIWRIFTSIFLHGSLSHILFNMFALGLFGSILEGLVGGRKFLGVFLLSGIFANIIALPFYSSSLGASGAIFGVIGALVVVRPLMAVWAFGMPMPMFIAGIIWATGDLIGLFVPSDIGHIAHLSGMAIGLIFGFVFRFSMPRQVSVKQERIKFDEDSIRRWEDRYLR